MELIYKSFCRRCEFIARHLFPQQFKSFQNIRVIKQSQQLQISIYAPFMKENSH